MSNPNFGVELARSDFLPLKRKGGLNMFLERIDSAGVENATQLDAVREAVRLALKVYFDIFRFCNTDKRPFRKQFDDHVATLDFSDQGDGAGDGEHIVFKPIFDDNPPGLCFRRDISTNPSFSRWQACYESRDKVTGIRTEIFYHNSIRRNPVSDFEPPFRLAEFVGRRTYGRDEIVDSGVLRTQRGVAIGELRLPISGGPIAREKIVFAEYSDNRGKNILDWKFYATFIGE